MNRVLNTASYDQFTDFKSVDEATKIKSKIIFSTEAYKELLRLIVDSKNSKNEKGCFFCGKEIVKDSNVIYIDEYTPEFNSSNGIYAGGAVEDNKDSQMYRRNKVINQKYDCLFHFHVHTAPIGSNYDVFSDQDLNVYKEYNASPWFQYYTKEEIERILNTPISDYEFNKIKDSFRNDDNNDYNYNYLRKKIPNHRKITYFGMLATPDRTEYNKHNNYQISIVLPYQQYNREGQLQTAFYRFPNIYYVLNDKIYEIGKFKRRNSPRLTNGRIVNNQNIYVQAIGRDPNFGNSIKDIEVGRYKDGKFYFERERSNNDIEII